jgi:hypothetical protein
MKKRWSFIGFLTGICTVSGVFWGQVTAPAPKIAVTTYHYDNLRTGWNANEKVLSPKSVLPGVTTLNRFGLLGRIPVDDTVYAQPLVVPDVMIASGVFAGKHDVVYVVTENNTVYAIDANIGTVLLKRNLGAAVVPPNGCNNNGPHVGIESTPAIDLGSQRMYLISYVMRSDRNPAYMLHAIDLTTLADQVQPAVVSATHKMTDNSTLAFSAFDHRQRAALLFEDGNIYAAFTSWCDTTPARGWLLGWQGAALQPLSLNILTNKVPKSRHSTIWMSGYGVAAIAGHLYFVTGNSDAHTYDATNHNNLSESVVKVSAGLGHVLDFFTPYGAGAMDGDESNRVGDLDFGSGGVLLLPDQPGGVPRLAAAAGKEGWMYLINREDMGGLNKGTDTSVGQYWIGGCFCGQSYYQNKIVSSGGDQIGVWQVYTSPSTGLTKTYSSENLGGRGDGFFTAISSNGDANVIIWAVSSHGSADLGSQQPTLFAFQPIQGDPQLKPLFQGPAGNWDLGNAGSPAPVSDANSNIVPVVANGHVYVASYKELDFFGFGNPVIKATLEAAATSLQEPAAAEQAKAKLGVITKVEGTRFTIKTATTGKEVEVEGEEALKNGLGPEPVIGQTVWVYGDADAHGVVHAKVIKRAHVPKEK